MTLYHECDNHIVRTQRQTKFTTHLNAGKRDMNAATLRDDHVVSAFEESVIRRQDTGCTIKLTNGDIVD